MVFENKKLNALNNPVLCSVLCRDQSLRCCLPRSNDSQIPLTQPHKWGWRGGGGGLSHEGLDRVPWFPEYYQAGKSKKNLLENFLHFFIKNYK